MSQPIRVEGWAYTPGARVSLRLQFRSQSTYARVKAEFHNPSGGVINLGGVTHTREESGAAHTEVVRTGRVPERAALGTYECRSVQGLTGDRNCAPIFDRTRLQHPRSRTRLPRAKWGRVSGT